MTLLWFFFVVMILAIIILTVFIVAITVQGKVAGGMSKSQAFKELLKEFFGIRK